MCCYNSDNYGPSVNKPVSSIVVMCSSFVALTACGTSDINVKSEDGSVITVKSASINSELFNKEDGTEEYEQWISRIEESLLRCKKEFPNKEMCNKEYGQAIEKKEAEKRTIASMPPVTIVKYQTLISTKDSGLGTSDDQYVACLPGDNTSDQQVWTNIIKSVNELKDKPMKNLVFIDYSSGNNVGNLLCEQFADKF